MPQRKRRRVPKRPEAPIDCRAGERYELRRVGKPPLTIRIDEVHVNMTADGPMPKAWYVALTKNGTARRKGARWEPRRAVAWLTWRDGWWRFPRGERIEQ
jgi:hypothetical protein